MSSQPVQALQRHISQVLLRLTIAKCFPALMYWIGRAVASGQPLLEAFCLWLPHSTR